MEKNECSVKRNSFHYASLSDSERLKIGLRFMSDGKPHTGWEIQQACGCLNPGGMISELKHNGMPFKKARYAGTVNGRKLYYYQMGVDEPEAELAAV